VQRLLDLVFPGDPAPRVNLALVVNFSMTQRVLAGELTNLDGLSFGLTGTLMWHETHLYNNTTIQHQKKYFWLVI
jgi:hypothetical protein